MSTAAGEMKIIARIHTDFSTKFGIPRQSGLAKDLAGKIVFEAEYRDPQACKGLEDFSHIWLIWQFSASIRDHWSATVRPPRLGGNQHLGVFATRSPFRPNPLGLSCVKLERIEIDPRVGPILHVRGADLMDNTPIFDIKPYIAYADSIPEARCGFANQRDKELIVDFPDNLLQLIPPEKRNALTDVLAQDPRPSYHNDPMHLYGFNFGNFDVRFVVSDGKIHVREIDSLIRTESENESD